MNDEITAGQDGISPLLAAASERTDGAIPISESMTWKPPPGRAYFGRLHVWKIVKILFRRNMM
ncbi:MAG: hypothetical protein ABL958_04030 [Bdellovibrionia bacterium]